MNAVLSQDGQTLIINFDDDLDEDSPPDINDFQLKDKFGNNVPFDWNGTNVLVGNGYLGTVTLKLASPISTSNQSPLSIYYENDNLIDDDPTGVIQDSFGIDAQTFTVPIQPPKFPLVPISLGSDADLVYQNGGGSGWVNVGANPTFQAFFQKLFPGSAINNQTLQSNDFSIDVSSAEFFGFVGTDPAKVSLYGFDSLALKGTSEEINLPKGGIFLTSGGGYYSSTNTSTGYSVNRTQTGNPIMDAFVTEAFTNAGSTYDASILRFRLTPKPGVESILLDLSFASDEYPEYADSSYVDIASIWFDNQAAEQNFAYFSDDNGAKKPLSIVGNTVTDGRFINNNLGQAGLPIEFDGITRPLTIAIPLKELQRNEDGSLTINLGVADSGDGVLDSAVWFSNFAGSSFGFEGTLLKKSVGAGEDFVAPTGTAVYVLAAPGSNLTPSTKPDIFELTPDPTATNQINIPDSIFINGDKYVNVNNNTTFVFSKPIQYSITKGSAIIAIDNGDGTTSTFTLVGDYFDINQFSVETSDDGRTTLRYTGPLVAGGGGGGGSGGDVGVDPVSSPSAVSPSIPSDSPLKNPAAIIVGDAGNNTFVGGDGSELFLGGDGNDNLTGGAGDDDIRGNAGDDVIRGGDGDDYIRGGRGNDAINGNKGNDRIFGDNGDDIIYGGQGSDTINGNAGNDQLWGGDWVLITS